MRSTAFLLWCATSMLLSSCATAQDDTTTNLDGGHGDTAHADLGVGTDGGTEASDSASDTAVPHDTSPGDVADSAIADSGIDTGIDTGVDSGIDSGVDTAPDVVVFDSPLDGGTTVEFPSASSTTYDTAGGGLSTLGAGGGGTFYVTGTYCEQSFPHAASVTRLDLNFRMSDFTSGCSAGATLGWDVKLNGTLVGSYSFVSTASGFGDRTIVESYTFAPVAAVGGNFTIRLEATSTVCSGGSSWDWYPGGTATMD